MGREEGHGPQRGFREENQAPGLGLSRRRGAGRRFPRSRQRARSPVPIPASGSLRLPPHVPGGGPASRPRLEHLGPDLVPLPRSRSHHIPKTTDLFPGKIFLMSFSFFQDRLLSTRPRSLNPSALWQGKPSETGCGAPGTAGGLPHPTPGL